MARTRSLGPKRRGFTLLEVILAVTISVVLLTALYLALNVQFYHTQAGREVVGEAVAIRSVLLLFTNDIKSSLGPVDPRVLPKSASAPTSPDTAASTPTSGTSATPTSGAAASTSGATSTDTSETDPSATAENNTISFNLGVYGDANRLVLAVSRVPRELSQVGPNGDRPLVSDLRRITYWLVEDGDISGGLARQELAQVTGADANALPPDVGDPWSFVIAKGVKSVAFEYFDGTAWQQSWDGTVTDPMTERPIGPPGAIAITVVYQRAGNSAGALTEIRHVVAIPAANSNIAPPPEEPAAPTDGP